MDPQLRQQLFDQLKGILVEFADGFEVRDEPGRFSLTTTKTIVVDGKAHEGYYFAGLRENKNIIGFYFMPIYVFPELREAVPASLKKILKGYTCFNFKSLNPEMIGDLRLMMENGIREYKIRQLL